MSSTSAVASYNRHPTIQWHQIRQTVDKMQLMVIATCCITFRYSTWNLRKTCFYIYSSREMSPTFWFSYFLHDFSTCLTKFSGAARLIRPYGLNAQLASSSAVVDDLAVVEDLRVAQSPSPPTPVISAIECGALMALDFFLPNLDDGGHLFTCSTASRPPEGRVLSREDDTTQSPARML